MIIVHTESICHQSLQNRSLCVNDDAVWW